MQFSIFSKIFVLLVCLAGIYVALPNLFKESKSFLSDDKVKLGLDLQGGSYLLLGVGIDKYMSEQLDGVGDEILRALKKSGIAQKGYKLDAEGISFVLTNAENIDNIKQIIADEVSGDIEVAGFDGGLVRVRFKESFTKQTLSQVVDQSIEIVRRRVDETGTREPQIQRQGKDRILLQVPGLNDPDELKKLLGKTAKLSFHPVVEALSGTTIKRPGIGKTIKKDQDGNRYILQKRAKVKGENLIGSRQTFDQNGQSAVSLKFDATGRRMFHKFSRDYLGKQFAIVLDDEIISAPVFREEIPGGNGQISGSFTVEEANYLSKLLRAGALPAPLNILEERTVGPSLGKDSIAAGKIASIVAVSLVALFMIVVYGLFGAFSVVALALNIIFLLAVLSLFEATLTLPGIAGIILTVGMAIDANVLIFERIREEVKKRNHPRDAVKIGFSKALITILDSNITTLLVAIILFSFGSGPVKGFAVTLSAGILCSLFTAIMVTRLLIVIWLDKKRPKKLPI